ncbi:hypothetical protein ACQ4PT_031398 [Festuca glaucescens]
MEDLPEALVAEIFNKITSTSDLNSLSLVSKQLYKTEGNQRAAIRVGSGLCTATEALTALCARFPNLRKVEIDYSGCVPRRVHQLDNKGLSMFSSHCSSLIDLTLSFCSYINDSGLGCLAHCKTLVSLRLISTPQITSIGIFSVAVGCTSLSALHFIDCEKIGVEWLEYLGRDGSLEELVVRNCKGISHHDLLKFGSGWMKLQKFEFEGNRGLYGICQGDVVYDFSYDAHSRDIYMIGAIVDFKFQGCSRDWPSEIEFTQKGFLALIRSCPIRVLVLDTANFLDEEGMKALSSSPHLETLELIFCPAVTDAGMRFIAHTPCLRNLTLRVCHEVTDVGVAELGREHKLESLVIDYCCRVSLQGVQGVAKSVHYSQNFSQRRLLLGSGC